MFNDKVELTLELNVRVLTSLVELIIVWIITKVCRIKLRLELEFANIA